MKAIKQFILALVRKAGYRIVSESGLSAREQQWIDTANRLKQAERQLNDLRQRLRAAKLVPDMAAAGAAETEPQNVGSGPQRRRERLPIVEGLLAILDAKAHFIVLDAGAREAHRDPRWRILGTERLSIRGFEPNQDECRRLNDEAAALGYDYKYYPIGLWDEAGTIPFEDNMAGGGSSFLRQNRLVTDRWKFENPHAVSLARDMFRPVQMIDVKTISVEQWAKDNGIGDLDFAKLNVQGAELKILETFGDRLSDVVGVLSEVSFVDSYVDRPFFADVDQFLRDRGFTFFDIVAHHHIGRADSPVAAQHLEWNERQFSGLVSVMGQLVEGHALYLRDPIDMELRGIDTQHFTTTKLMKLICVAEIFGQIEYAFELFKWLTTRLRQQGDLVLANTLEGARDRAAGIYREVHSREPQ